MMTIRKIARGMGSLVMVFAFSPWLSAQTVEVNPYAGGLLAPSSVDVTIGALDSLTKRGRQMYDTLLKDTDLRREEL